MKPETLATQSSILLVKLKSYSRCLLKSIGCKTELSQREQLVKACKRDNEQEKLIAGLLEKKNKPDESIVIA